MELLLAVSFVITMIVCPIAWVLGLVYMIKTVSHRKPGIRLWRDAPYWNPWNHVLVTSNLTEQGLEYRRRLQIAVAAFLIPLLLTLGLASITGNLK